LGQEGRAKPHRAALKAVTTLARRETWFEASWAVEDVQEGSASPSRHWRLD
jgi:hypothetical protein